MTHRVLQFVFGVVLACVTVGLPEPAESAAANRPHWVAAWAASAQGPYPVGNPTAQPEMKYAFQAGDSSFFAVRAA